jgi:hypothetical protein
MKISGAMQPPRRRTDDVADSLGSQMTTVGPSSAIPSGPCGIAADYPYSRSRRALPSPAYLLNLRVEASFAHATVSALSAHGRAREGPLRTAVAQAYSPRKDNIFWRPSEVQVVSRPGQPCDRTLERWPRLEPRSLCGRLRRFA